MKDLRYAAIGTPLESLFFDKKNDVSHQLLFGPEYCRFTEDRTKRRIIFTTVTTYTPKWSPKAPLERRTSETTYHGHLVYHQDLSTDAVDYKKARELDALWKERTDSVVHIRFGQRAA